MKEITIRKAIDDLNQQELNHELCAKENHEFDLTIDRIILSQRRVKIISN